MMHKWVVTPRQRCDLEMILNKGFAPLTGFITQPDYENVIHSMRLANHSLWPMPITFDVPVEFAEKISLSDKVELYDVDNTLLAQMTVTDKWQPNKMLEAKQVFGTQDLKHPAVNYLIKTAGDYYLGGPIELVQMPKHHDFTELRFTPDALKTLFSKLGLNHIVGFQTRNPIHRAHMELTLRAAQQIDGHVLIHPVVGLTKPGDIDYFTRVRCYQKILHYYPSQKALLSLLPLAMRMGGPREALWHALIRKNYGCTHFIVGRDHAGPGNDSNGNAFYDPYAAQKIALDYQDEMGISIIPFHEMVYVKERRQYCPSNELTSSDTPLSISGTELRSRLLTEQPIPEWFSFPEIIQELHQAYPPKHKQGFTLFFTGLSGAGKTTLANALIAKLMSQGRRNITLLDGDVVRRILTNELGFSKAERDLNIKRIGYVASEVTKAGGVVICAAIAPYREARDSNRQLISQHGGFIEIYLSTSVLECEKRDTKGLYAKARRGELKGLTGIDDPYEPPLEAEIEIDTSICNIEDSVNNIMHFLQDAGYLQTTKDKIKEGMI